MTARTLGLALVLATGCGAVSSSVPEGGSRSAAPPQREPRFKLLGSAIADVTREVDVPSASGPTRKASYRVQLVAEPSPTTAGLNAVLIRPTERVFAVGDRGTVVTRTPSGPWQLEPTPTQEPLHAVAAAGITVLAVGAGGVALRQEQPGRWEQEASGTDQTLRAVLMESYGSYAAGDGGTLLYRDTKSKQWSKLATGTSNDLLALFHCRDCGAYAYNARKESVVIIYAAGRGGTLIRCEGRLGAPPQCAPAPTLPAGDLTGFVTSYPTVIVGANGVLVGAGDGEVPPWTVERQGGADLLAGAFNHWMWTVGDDMIKPEPMVVGRAGTWGFVSSARPLVLDVQPATLSTDLRAIDSEELDVVIVGDGGTILHGGVFGVEIPTVTIH